MFPFVLHSDNPARPETYHPILRSVQEVREIGMDDFLEMKERDLPNAAACIEAMPDDVSEVVAALNTMIFFGDVEGFDKAVKVLKDRFGDNDAVQNAIGMGLDRIGRHEEAAEICRRAVELNDSAENRAAMGNNLIFRKALKEAERFYGELISAGDRRSVTLLNLLILMHNRLRNREDWARLSETRKAMIEGAAYKAPEARKVSEEDIFRSYNPRRRGDYRSRMLNLSGA